MKTILFIDDDLDFLAAQNGFFTEQGYRVLTAESGQQAIELLGNETPDMIIMELMLEHSDTGFTLAYAFSKLERLASTPIIVLSKVASVTGKYFDTYAKEMGQWVGVDAFHDKPVEQGQLLQLVRERLG